MKKRSKNKPTFEEFLRKIYGMNMLEWQELPAAQRTAVEIDYKDRYGSPIIWW